MPQQNSLRSRTAQWARKLPLIEGGDPRLARGYMAAAVEKGIITGLPGNRFGGDEQITREQMAVLITRALQFQGTDDTTFTDNGDMG